MKPTDLVAAGEGRLDRVVSDQLAVPRADVQRAIEGGRVLVDGTARPKSFRLSGGEKISIDLGVAGALEPEYPAVPILYEDEHLAVIDKPAGLVTHPTTTRRTGTLVNRLLGMQMLLAPGGGELRPGIVHRLDAGTSGLMIVAKDDAAFHALQVMMRKHTVERRYLALVRGVPEHDRFVVEAPLERRRAKIVVRTVTGRAAETAFEVRERFARAALLEAAPKTGRTHQIRVHLSAVGHPIIGDKTYGGGGDEAKRLGLASPFLHSWFVSFDHPLTGERITCESALPEDLESALEMLRG